MSISKRMKIVEVRNIRIRIAPICIAKVFSQYAQKVATNTILRAI